MIPRPLPELLFLGRRMQIDPKDRPRASNEPYRIATASTRIAQGGFLERKGMVFRRSF